MINSYKAGKETFKLCLYTNKLACYTVLTTFIFIWIVLQGRTSLGAGGTFADCGQTLQPGITICWELNYLCSNTEKKLWLRYISFFAPLRLEKSVNQLLLLSFMELLFWLSSGKQSGMAVYSYHKQGFLSWQNDLLHWKQSKAVFKVSSHEKSCLKGLLFNFLWLC